MIKLNFFLLLINWAILSKQNKRKKTYKKTNFETDERYAKKRSLIIKLYLWNDQHDDDSLNILQFLVYGLENGWKINTKWN